MLRFLVSGLAAGALIAAGLFAANDLRNAINERDRRIDQRADDLIAAERLRGLDERRSRTSRSLLLTGNPRFHREWQLTIEEFYALLGQLKARSEPVQTLPLLEEVERAARLNDARVEPLLKRRLAGETADALGKVFEAEVQPSRDELDGTIEVFLLTEQGRLRSSPGELSPTEGRALGFIFAITVAAVLLAIVAAWTARRATLNAKAAAVAQSTAEAELAHRREVEASLSAKTMDLERSNADLERFAYVASHDLQEPLRTVAGFAELLGRRYKGKLDSDADEFIAYVLSGVAQMQRLITDLLAFSRVTRLGRAAVETDSGKALDRAVASLRASIETAKVHIERSSMPRVLADETQLSQVFQNLLSNAIKFRKNESAEIRVSAQRHGPEWQFDVSDNGIGIESQYFDRIFVLFQRLHERDRYDGTGLGLAIAKRVVEFHGGRMWVDSTHGVGSTFHFTLKSVEPSLEEAASIS